MILQRVLVQNMNVIVIGAGAAGLTAAVFGAKSGDKVIVIEHESRPGKKISITGNGKCNITNKDTGADKYYGDKKFIESILKKFNYKDTLSLFEDMGVYCHEKNGFYYPRSNQAATVSNNIRDYALSLGVSIKTNNQVKNIEYINGKFVIDIGIKMICDKLVIATGGMSAPKTGSDGSGYKMAEKLGHTIIKPKPALTGLICDESLKRASGVRVKARVLVENTDISDIGELQITDYGVSGIPIFNISRMTDKGSRLSIDFLPDDTYESVYKKIKRIFDVKPEAAAQNALNGLLNEKLAGAVLAKADLKENAKCRDISDKNVKYLVKVIKDFMITIQRRKGFDFAQVTQGGVSTMEINPDTMESLICKNLYFAGEVVDVDGRCGGFNLQFAWSSGSVAGGYGNK